MKGDTLPRYEALAPLIEFRDDGKPYWLESRGTKVRAGRIAGTISRAGYRKIAITLDGKFGLVAAHRLLWFQVHGELPGIIDHIDRNPDNNRICNLRECTISQNSRNRKGTGASGYVGVGLHTAAPGKWYASIAINKTRHWLGLFDREDDAARAYRDAAIRLGVGGHANLIGEDSP